jgi:hypothetical protein
LPFLFLKNAETSLSRILYLGIIQFLQMTLDMMKELFGIIHVGEEEVPNAKHMCIGEEEVSLS